MPRPTVRVIGQPVLDTEALLTYLDDVAGEDAELGDLSVFDEGLPDGERIVEVAGRLCYRSWVPGLNRNVTKVRADHAEYIANLIRSGHGSVFEHVSITFILSDISRICTHELVRHRVGTAISQESGRYVALDDKTQWRDTPSIGKPSNRARLDAKARELIALIREVEEDELRDRQAYKDGDDPGFTYKKALTSDLRTFAPSGLLTAMVWTANIRTLRGVIEQRTAHGAEWEIRELFDKIAKVCALMYPEFFADFVRSASGAWTTPNSKI